MRGIDLALLFVAIAPHLLAFFTRRRSLQNRETVSQSRSKVDQFNALYQAQGALVADCRKRCGEMEEAANKMGAEHAQQIAAFERRHNVEIEGWQRKYVELEGNYNELKERLEYLEDLMRGMGLGGKVTEARRQSGGRRKG